MLWLRKLDKRSTWEDRKALRSARCVLETLVELLMINGGYAKMGMSGPEIVALAKVRIMLQEVNSLAECEDYKWGANPTGLRYAFHIAPKKLKDTTSFALELGDDADDIKLGFGLTDGLTVVKQLSSLFLGEGFWEKSQCGGVSKIKISLRLHGHDAAEWTCKETLAGTLAYEKKVAQAVLKRFSVLTKHIYCCPPFSAYENYFFWF